MHRSLGYYAIMVSIMSIACLGLIGNTLAALVLFQKEMHSSYNFLLLGLTFSDAFLLILSSLWSLDNLQIIELTKANQSTQIAIFFWDWICTGGTIYFTVAISLERYLVVCYPLKARGLITPKRSRIFASSVLAFVICLSIWSYLYNYHIDSNSFNIFAAVVLHFFPISAISALNLLIFFGLRRFQRERQSLTDSEASEVSVTRMLLMVVLVFTICHSFEIIRRVMNYFGYFDMSHHDYYEYTICILADIFHALNSAVNFIVYYLMGNKFRHEFSNLFKRKKSNHGQPSDESNSNLKNIS